MVIGLGTVGAQNCISWGTLGADTAIHCYLLLHQKIVYLSHFCPKCAPAVPQLLLSSAPSVPQVTFCPNCAPGNTILCPKCAPSVLQVCPKCAQPDYQNAYYFHKRLETKYKPRDLAADQSRVANTRIKTILKGVKLEFQPLVARCQKIVLSAIEPCDPMMRTRQ